MLVTYYVLTFHLLFVFSINFSHCFYKVFLMRKLVNFSVMFSGSWHCFYKHAIYMWELQGKEKNYMFKHAKA